MSQYSTGAYGAEHRAIMHEGHTVALAESVQVASTIVRALNDQERAQRTAKQLVLMRDEIEELSKQGEIIYPSELRALLRIHQGGQAS